jgi:hypothetical protein
MNAKLLKLFTLLIVTFAFSPAKIRAENKESNRLIKVTLQKRVASDSVKGVTVLVQEMKEWNVQETAIIICDMWNEHWCRGATERVAEMAPLMNNVITVARNRGVLIVHAPSECITYYKNHPARILAQKFKGNTVGKLICNDKLPSEKDAVWPVDQSDGGCDCTPECKERYPWTHEIDALNIEASDAISDSGTEIGGLFKNQHVRDRPFFWIKEHGQVGNECRFDARPDRHDVRFQTMAQGFAFYRQQLNQ